jgi:rhodanese-related sulfurtransferase
LNFLIDNIFLVLIAFVSGGMLVWPLVSKARGVKLIGTLEATQLLNSKNAILVDLREDNQIVGGIVPQALKLPMSNFHEGILELKKKSKLHKNTVPIILLTSSGTGASSVVKKLEQDGFVEVFGLDGGFEAWKQAGLPVKSN